MPLEPLCILICVRENCTYLTQPHTASQGVVNIRDVDVIEKLTVPSAQPRKVKLVLFGQSHSARAQC